MATPPLNNVDPNSAVTTHSSEQRIVDWSHEKADEDQKNRPSVSQAQAYQKDTHFYRSIISFAGWTLILSVGGMLILAVQEVAIPHGVVAVSSGLVGLLTGIFVSNK